MKHLLSAKDLTHDEAVMVLDTAEAMAATQSQAVKKLPTLRGKTVVNLFFEDSTRTRLSFEAAAKRLSADVINFSAKGSSLSKGESLKDTAQTIMAMGADAVVVRHSGLRRRAPAGPRRLDQRARPQRGRRYPPAPHSGPPGRHDPAPLVRPRSPRHRQRQSRPAGARS